MKSKFANKISSTFAVLIVITLIVGCGAPTPAPTEAPPPPPAETLPPEATEPPAAGDVKEFQADPTNLFPNGIGEVRCEGVNLVVATQTGPQIASPMENHWQEWADKTGGTVEVQTFPFGELFEKIRAGYVSGASPFDIIVYASDWAGDLMGAGYLLEVPQKNQEMMGYQYLIPTYRDRILSWGGTMYGTPNDGEPIYGAGTAFKRGGQSYWTFLGIAAAFAKSPNDPAYFFDPETMIPRINHPGCGEALDFYQSLVPVRPPDVVNWDVGAIRNNFPAGKLALGIDWGDVGPLAADPNSSIVTGKWSARMAPGADRVYDSP